MKTLLIFAITATLLMAGCSNTEYQPVLDGAASESYSADLAACRQLANEHSNISGDAKSGALVGAGLGAVIGLADSSSSDGEDALTGAAIGAVLGGLSATAESTEKNQAMVFQCMRGRGHRVIG